MVPTKCEICHKQLKKSYFLKCTICDGLYHLNCTSHNRLDYEFIEKDVWSCERCNQVFFHNHYDDDNDFLTTLSNFFCEKTHLDFQKLNEKIFSPFELNDEKVNNPLYTNDPDFQYFSDMCSNSLSDSPYYTEDS